MKYLGERAIVYRREKLSMDLVRAALKRYLPESAVKAIRRWRARRFEREYFAQPLILVQCGAFLLEAPASHLLATVQATQPDRDLCVGIAAKFIAEKYPAATFVDVGANIGDTAAMMASYAPNKLVLVEGSPYFFELLRRNAARLPNPCVLEHAFVADGTVRRGSFVHRLGTAAFAETARGRRLASRRLSEICDDTTRFIKTDTDGFDFRILRCELAWLARVGPAVLFEDEIQTEAELRAADELVEHLGASGYAYFLVWDHASRLIEATDSLQRVRELHRELYEIWHGPGPKHISNYDVLCLHRRDADVFAKLAGWWRSRQPEPEMQ
jgi:FkbM family methyltransferase